MESDVIKMDNIKEHYQLCKNEILRYCKEGDCFRALIGDHNHWWKTDREKGTAQLFYPADEDYDALTSKYRTLYWTAQLFYPETADIEKPFDFEKHQISEQIGGREDTIYHSFFLDLDKVKGKEINDEGVIEWLEKGIKFFADKLLNAGVKSFGLSFSGGGVYCVLHPRLGMVGKEEKDKEYVTEIIQRAFDLFIGDVAAEFFERYPEAIGYVKFDKLNYDKKRQVKTILSVHKKYPYAVIPLAKENPKIDLEEATLPISDETIEKVKKWIDYQDDIENFGELLKPWLEKAKATIKKTHGTRTVSLETEEVEQGHWSPCMKNIVDMKNLKSGGGATRALSVLASYMRFVGVSEEKAYNLFQQKAKEWDAETSNIFESWYGCEHLDKPTCFVPSCEKMRTKGSGYPHPELGELEICTPDERCREIRSPVQYHKKSGEKLRDTDYYLIFYDTGSFKGIAHKLFGDDLIPLYHFKTLDDTKEILYYKEGYYHYNGEAVIEAECERVLQGYLKINDVNEIMSHIRRSTYINRIELNKDKSILPLQNGLFDLNSYLLTDFNPEIILTYHLPVEYNPDADCPKFKKFIGEILKPEDIPIVQQFFGYTLYPSLPAHKSLWMYGIGRNGKSSLVRLLIALLGDDSVASVPIEELGGWHRFSIARLYGKLLNATSEPGTTHPLKSALLKKLLGGDKVSAEIKGKQRTIDFINIAKFIVLGNIFPQVDDTTLAFWDRIIVVEFPNIFINDFIPDITDMLIKEEGLSGFFNWCIQGLKQLRDNNFHFSTSKNIEQMKLEFEKLSNPFIAFVKERCVINVDSIIPKGDIYDFYKDYCADGGYQIIGKGEFTKKMGEMQGITGTKARYQGKVVHCWRGIELAPMVEIDENVDAVAKVDLSTCYPFYGRDNNTYNTHDNEVDIQPVNKDNNGNDESKHFLKVEVRILEDLPTFMGIDQELYQLKKGQTVNLPKINADSLIKRNVAVALMNDRDVAKAIRETIKVLEKEYGEEVPLSEVFDEVDVEGMDSDKVEEMIELMKRDGILYSPRSDVIKFVR